MGLFTVHSEFDYCFPVFTVFALRFSAGYILKDKSLENDLLTGTGICDITGPAAEAVTAGFTAGPKQIEGINFRLYARAFIVSESNSSKSIAVVIADLWSCTQAIKNEVVKRLKTDFNGNMFTADNVLIGGTHTHNGPGGYSHYPLYNFTSNGFDKLNFEAIVNGIVEAVKIARNNLSPGKIYINSGKIEECGWNRSPGAYLNNPEVERNKYDGDTDKDILVLKFKKKNGKELGCLNWKAIHPTVLGENDNLISGNNKGYASYLFEKAMESNPPEEETFIAAFANSNCGDVSGNVQPDNAEENLELVNMYELGRKQFFAAWDLYNLAKEEITGNIDYRHRYINMSNTHIEDSVNRTYPAALGIGPLFRNKNEGTFNLTGSGETPSSNKNNLKDISEKFVSSTLKYCNAHIKGFSYPENLSEELIKGHGAKSIILAPGISHPFPMSPEILPLQIIRLGSLAILSVPGEISTMAGRRLREAIINILKPIGVKYIAINAYANAFAGHITTKEEYEKQSYEGASTHFGPYTLDAFLQEFKRLAKSIVEGKKCEPGPLPADLSDRQFSPHTGVMMDTSPSSNYKFGSIRTDADTFYKPGDTVKVVFWGAYPNNNFRNGDSFIRIEKKENDKWVIIYTDRDPCTIYRWARELMASSLITVSWMIDNDVKSGEYRIRHSGDWKSSSGKITPYEGVSGIFRVGTGLGSNELLFRNIYDNQVDLMFYHPGDRLRLVPYKSYSLKPYDIYTWTIPPGWDEAQVIFNIKNQKFSFPGRSIITIRKSGSIKVESG